MTDNRLPLLPLVLARVPATLRCVLGQEGIAFCDLDESPRGQFVLFDSLLAPCPPLAPQQLAIDIHELRSGWREDPFVALDDSQAERCRWQVAHLTVSEEVARIDKRAVRQRLMKQLRAILEAAGGIWLRLSSFPFPYRSAFNFRLDYDEYVAEDFNAVEKTWKGFEESFSHYVCASTFVAHPEVLARLSGLDVGSHGFWHHSYLEKAENRRNIERGIEALRTAGIEPSGFVAPHGRFHSGLVEVLAELGVTHSSEFGLAYDDLPFFPGDGNVLQIPIHPICLGICLEAAEQRSDEPGERTAAAEALKEYFQWVATAKYQSGEPVFLYGHPERRLGRYPQVIEGVLETVAGFGAIWKTNLSQFATWWRARSAVRWELYREASQYTIMVDRLPAGFRLGVEYWRGEHVAPMPVDDRSVHFSPAALAFQSRKPRELPTRWRVDQAQSLRAGVLRYLDWEKVTPWQEIDGRTLRGWVKRTLRRIRS